MQSFIWRDGDRTIVFREGLGEDVAGALREQGVEEFHLLSTPRRLEDAPGLADAATAVHEVAPGGVPDAAAALLDAADAERLVAFGGGRVIDTAKAVASVSGASVAAVPTTMSGAEMTVIHRLPAGAEGRASGLVRPDLVLADPRLMTGQEEADLRASSLNALAHGADSLYTPYANPMSRHAALRGSALIAAALDEPLESRDPAPLALGSVLCGYAIDSGLFGLHHVMCQTLVRVVGSPHAQTNAAVLPHAMEALERRVPDHMSELGDAVGAGGDLVGRLHELRGETPGLGEAGGDAERIDEAVEAMLARGELRHTPDPPDAAELRRMVDSAW